MSLPQSDSDNDLDLARAASGGDDGAFRDLLRRHLQPLRAYIALRLPLPDVIDEVAHDTFLFAHRRLGDFQEGSMQAWLRAIAFNLLRDRIKSHVREAAKLERYGEHVRWELAVDDVAKPTSDEADHLEDCLAALSENHRRVVALRYDLDLSSDEIATRLGRSALAVRTLLVRVREHLRQCIKFRMENPQTTL